jgi:hypothetical protein
MNVVLWIGVVVVALFAVPAAFFFVLYLGSGEPVPRDRAAKLGRWAWLAVLITFNIQIWGRVAKGVFDLMRH